MPDSTSPNRQSADVTPPHVVHAEVGHLPVVHESDGGAHVPTHAAQSTARWLVVFVVLLAAGLGLTFFLVTRHRTMAEKKLQDETTAEAATAPPVDVIRAVASTPLHEISLPGEARAWYESTVYARANGYLKKWFVDIGDHVKAGQVLATIETPELDQQLAGAEARVESDKAQVALAKANTHFTEVTLARFKDAPKGVVSDLERDEKQADYQTSVARAAAAEADLHAAQSEVDRLRAMTEFQKVTAPFDGTITERRVDIGDLVTAGSTASTTSLFRIAQSDKLRIFVDVPQTAAADIHDGDKAKLTFNGLTTMGTVARNARNISAASKTLRVEVDVPNEKLTLLPGMYLDVAFEVNDDRTMVQIPASALNFRTNGPQVAVVANDGRVAFRDVTIARDQGTVVEIGQGLSAGERVALNISNQVTDGQQVAATEIQDPAGAPSADEKASPATVASAGK